MKWASKATSSFIPLPFLLGNSQFKGSDAWARGREGAIRHRLPPEECCRRLLMYLAYQEDF